MIAAYAVEDGRPRWTLELAADQALAADAGRLYVASGQALHAINARDGSVAWRAAPGRPLTAPPLAHAGWVVAAAGGELLALRAADGTVVWRKEVGPVEFRPALDGELLVVSVVDGRLTALNLTDGALLWQRDLGSLPGEPVVLGGRVYVGTKDKTFYALHASSGRIEDRRALGAEVRGRVALDEESVFVAAMDNMLRAFDRRSGSLRWQKGVAYRPTSGPVLLGTLVVVPGRAETPLPAFAATSGAPGGTVDFGGYLLQNPLFTTLPDGRHAVLGITGSLTNTMSLFLRAASIVPALPVAPLTALPGESVPLPQAPVR